MTLVPCLHVGLTVLFVTRVVKLESAETSSGHEKVGDVLDVLNILLLCVLEDGEDFGVAGDC